MNKLERQAEPKCARHCNNLIQGEYLEIRRLSAEYHECHAAMAREEEILPVGLRRVL